MSLTELQGVANTVVRRAQRQGFVLPRDIRAELTRMGLPEEQWKDVIELARESLHFRQGRYFFLSSVSPRLRQELTQQQLIARAIQRLIRHHRTQTSPNDRRREDRLDFIQPVKVRSDDGHETTLLSRDLSTTGIRLIGTRSLLGQKIRVQLPAGDDGSVLTLLVRILWTAAIGDELFENGGSFIEMVAPPTEGLKLVGTS